MANTDHIAEAQANIEKAKKRIEEIDRQIEALAQERNTVESNVEDDEHLIRVFDAYSQGKIKSVLGVNNKQQAAKSTRDRSGEPRTVREPRGGARMDPAAARDAIKAILAKEDALTVADIMQRLAESDFAVTGADDKARTRNITNALFDRNPNKGEFRRENGLISLA